MQKALCRKSATVIDRRYIFSTPPSPHAIVFPDLKHTLEFAAESLLNYTPIPEEKPSGQQDFLAEMESPDANQLSARRAMERADLALQLHAILAPEARRIGPGAGFH